MASVQMEWVPAESVQMESVCPQRVEQALCLVSGEQELFQV
jgi:hypothetical protein